MTLSHCRISTDSFPSFRRFHPLHWAQRIIFNPISDGPRKNPYPLCQRQNSPVSIILLFTEKSAKEPLHSLIPTYKRLISIILMKVKKFTNSITPIAEPG